jgi:hypothetical protein
MSALSYSRKPSRLHSLRRRARERERTESRPRVGRRVGRRDRPPHATRLGRRPVAATAQGQGAAHEISVTWLLAIFSNIFWISVRACFTCACAGGAWRASVLGASSAGRVLREARETWACELLGRAYREVAADGGQEVRLRGVARDARHPEPLYLAHHGRGS